MSLIDISLAEGSIGTKHLSVPQVRWRIKEFGQEVLQKQEEKGGMFSSNVGRSTYDETLPSQKRQKTDKVDISFTVIPLMINNLILRRFLEEKV